MKINRETFLNDLLMVRAGLSPREFIEQSSCFVFMDGQVMTFNDEIACKKKIELDITGAVQSTSLLAILEKINDPDLMVEENDKGELEFKGKRKRFGVTKEAEIFLPVSKVEIPEKWRKIPKEFTKAIELVHQCVSSDESKFTLTCIHLHPEYIEACDNIQIMRRQVDTHLKSSVLVRGSSLQHILTLGMDKMALTKSWIHFRNQQGLVFSCRRYAEEFPALDDILSFEGHSIVIPRGLAEVSERAAVFAADKAGDPLVAVTIKNGKIRIVGEGLSGWFQEIKGVNYDGPPLEFSIPPVLLKHISEEYKEAQITKTKLRAVGGNWEYCTVLGPREEEEAEEETNE